MKNVAMVNENLPAQVPAGKSQPIPRKMGKLPNPTN